MVATKPQRMGKRVSLLFIIAFASWPASGAWGLPTFDTVQFGFSNGPFGVASTVPQASTGLPLPADINGDGFKADLAVANADGSTISLYFNTGSGLSNTPMNLVGLNQPHAIALGDFDGDGKIDIAATNFNASTVSVFFNNGGSSFAGALNVTVGADPLGVVAGRFHTGAAYDDLLVVAKSNATGGTVNVLTTGGTRSFSKTTMTVGSKPQFLVVRDFGTNASNAAPDTKLDFAVTLNGVGQVKLYFGAGNGTFTADTHTYTADQNPIGVTSGDFNGDGCSTDLAITNHGTLADGSARNLVSLVPGKCSGSAGSFGNSTVLATFSDPNASPFSISRVQLNGSATAVDLALTDTALSKTILMRNDTVTPGFPVFTQTVCTTDSSPEGIAAADFNNDNIDDWAVANKNTDTIRIATGDGVGSSCPSSTQLGNVVAAKKPVAVAICDVTNSAGTGAPDGNNDLVVLDQGNANVVVFAGSGTGVFSRSTQPATAVATGASANAIACGDLDNDGRLDIGVTVEGSSNTAQFFCNQGNGTFSSCQTQTGLSTPKSVVFTDLLADGSRNDFSVANSGNASVFTSTAGAVSIATYNSPVSVRDGVFNASLNDLAAAPSVANFVAFLMNNISNTAGRNGLDFYLSAQGLGNSPITGSPANFPFWVTAGDFDLNSHLDAVTANPNQKDVTILLGLGTNQWQSAFSYKAGSKPNSVAVADFDVNGTLDVAAADSTRDEVAILSGNGCPASCTSCSGSPMVGCQSSILTACPPNTDTCEFLAGTAPQWIQQGNLNGDCKPDIVVVNPLSGSITLLLNTTNVCCTGCGGC